MERAGAAVAAVVLQRVPRHGHRRVRKRQQRRRRQGVRAGAGRGGTRGADRRGRRRPRRARRDRRRAARDRSARRTARGRCAHDRADQRGAPPRRRGRRPLGRERVDGRGAGRRGARDDDGDVRRREGRPRHRARALPRGQRPSRADRAAPARARARARPGLGAARRPAQATALDEVQRRLGARGRRLARPDRRADARGARGVPRRRRLRRGRRARVDAAGARDVAARGREAPARRGSRRPAAPALRGRDPRGGREGDAVAIGPGLGRSDGTVELVRILLERLDLPVVLDADALWELEPFARAAPTVLTPHSGELGRLLARREPRDRRAPARRRRAAPRRASARSCC